MNDGKTRNDKKWIKMWSATTAKLFRGVQDTVAPMEKRIETVRNLIKGGADVNALTIFGQTPLHIAIIYENYEIATVLMEEGADVNVKDRNGNTPLNAQRIEFKIQ
jgi:hypothetical protein